MTDLRQTKQPAQSNIFYPIILYLGYLLTFENKNVDSFYTKCYSLSTIFINIIKDPTTFLLGKRRSSRIGIHDPISIGYMFASASHISWQVDEQMADFMSQGSSIYKSMIQQDAGAGVRC